MPNLYPSDLPSGVARSAIPVDDRPVELEGAVLRRCGEKHVLFARRDSLLLVNGRPVTAGVRVLAHRDRIHAGSEVWWFSAEDPARVEPFPGGDAVCPRCRQHVAEGSPAVRCPCGNWFHRREDLPCFDYAAACPVCQRATTLAAPAAGPEED